MLGSVAAISAVSIMIPNDPDILCLLGYKLTECRLVPLTLAAQRCRPRKFSDIDITQRDRIDIQLGRHQIAAVHEPAQTVRALGVEVPSGIADEIIE